MDGGSLPPHGGLEDALRQSRPPLCQQRSDERRTYDCIEDKRAPQPMDTDHALESEGCCQHHPVTCLESSEGNLVSQGASGAWYTNRNIIFEMNEMHGDFRRVFFENFRALLEETNDEAYMCLMADYVRWILSMYMFVRVERPRGSKQFVLGYVKCDWVFSFARRFEQMRLRLNCVPPLVLTDVEEGENKALRLACVGETDYERALATHRNDDGVPPLNAALWAKDEESAVALLDGGDDPNEVNEFGWNALHNAAIKGCRSPLFQRLLARIHDVNTVDSHGSTALILAAAFNQLDVVILLMNHPGIDLNVQDRCWQGRRNSTALHKAVEYNHPAIVAQLLSDDKIDCRLIDCNDWTSLEFAIEMDHEERRDGEIVKILREHEAPEE